MNIGRGSFVQTNVQRRQMTTITMRSLSCIDLITTSQWLKIMICTDINVTVDLVPRQ